MAGAKKSLALALASVTILLALVCANWPNGKPTELDSSIFEEPTSLGLELIQKGAKILHARFGETSVASEARSNQKASAIIQTTTLSADFGVSANGVGNLPVFITGICTDLVVMTICLLIWYVCNSRYKIMFRDNILKGYTKKFRGEPLNDWASDNNQPAQTTLFGWARASWALKLEDVWEVAGFDHAMLIEFADFGFYSMRLIALPVFFITGPLNWLFGGNAAGQDHESWFSLGNVKFYNNLYYVTAVVTWYVAFIITWKCEQGMKKFIPLRMLWLTLWDDLRAHTLLMIGIPEQFQSDEACKEFWDKIFPDGRVKEVKVTKDTSSVYRAWTSKTAAEKKLQTLKPEEDKATYEQHLSDSTKEYEEAVAELKEQNKKGEGFCSTGFVTFKRREDAEVALRLDLSNDINTWVLEYAAVPKEIIWGDMTQDPRADSGRLIIGYSLTALLVFLYMPLVVAMSNLASAINLGPLQPIWSSEAPSIGLTIMTDFLPTILVTIFRNFFSVYDGMLLQYKLSVWYWWMNVFFVVMITALGTNFLSFVETLAKNPTSIFSLLATTMPECTHYYMNYLGMQWYSITMVFTRYIPVIKYKSFSKAGYSDEEAKEMSEPEDQDYYGMGSRTARWSTFMCIGIVYGTLSPPCGMLCFFTMTIIRVIFGYQFTFAETRKTDMGGIFYVRALHNMYCTLHLYFIVMIGVLIQRGSSFGPAVIAAGAWAMVFYKQKKWNNLKWERLTYSALQKIDEQDEAIASLDRQPEKMSTLGEYTQPELPADFTPPELPADDTATKTEAEEKKEVRSSWFG